MLVRAVQMTCMFRVLMAGLQWLSCRIAVCWAVPEITGRGGWQRFLNCSKRSSAAAATHIWNDRLVQCCHNR
jgi:hypothetical protein